MKRDDLHYGIAEEELSSSEDEKESDFDFCHLLPGEKNTCHERTFLVYE